MRITKQTNSNECGMCVVNSLMQHYYRHSDKNKIVSDAVVTDKGLSIFEFESLCLNNGLEPFSDQLTVDEFKQLDT
ncbi:MAG: bacteriocin ABC transporter ATP-binding protein, partial [Malacoplasma sp.]|nr:bacteriocin ABC transporter ATP-binding protein [Malacoplasma sp.]